MVLHDLVAGKGNVDHIAVGPGGVSLLDSKRLGGSVTVDDRGVTVRRLDDPDLAYQHTGDRHLLSLARQTHDRVLAARRIRTWVTPVMVLWAEFPQRVAEDRCFYIHGDELVSWLRARPQTIAPRRVGQIADAVHESWEAQTMPVGKVLTGGSARVVLSRVAHDTGLTQPSWCSAGATGSGRPGAGAGLVNAPVRGGGKAPRPPCGRDRPRCRRPPARRHRD